jgi:hypothetical protein
VIQAEPDLEQAKRQIERAETGATHRRCGRQFFQIANLTIDFEVGSPVISSRERVTSEIDVVMWETESPSIATVFEAERIRVEPVVLVTGQMGGLAGLKQGAEQCTVSAATTRTRLGSSRRYSGSRSCPRSTSHRQVTLPSREVTRASAPAGNAPSSALGQPASALVRRPGDGR